MPQSRQHVPERSSQVSPMRPAGPTPGGGLGNAARAERLREAGAIGPNAAGTAEEAPQVGLNAPQVAGVGPGIGSGVGTGTQAGGPAAVQTAVVDAAPGAGAIVLARGVDATRAALPEQRARVRIWAEFWAMPWSDAWVRLGEDGGAAAVVLDWPTAAWGAPPTTRDFSNGRMQPVDARFAVKSARDSAGWPTLAADVQTRVERVLSGETNNLSSAAHSMLRSAIRSGWKTQPAEEQAKFLQDLVDTSVSRPMVVRERNATARAQVTRSGPTEVTGHAFRSGAADAYRYVLTFADGQAVEVFVPKVQDPTRGYHTIEQIEEAVAFLPDANRRVLRVVQLNPGTNPEDAYWAQEYNRPNFRSYMTAGAAGIVDVYPDATPTAAPQSSATSALQHETGHVWSLRTWGNDTTQGKWVDWQAAMTADGMSVSSYATSDIVEDVAETIQAYSSTRGSPAHDEYRRMFPARFAMLDAELS